jgi:hypothetical protein
MLGREWKLSERRFRSSNSRQAVVFTLALLLCKLYGVGKPRSLQGLSADQFHALLASPSLWRAAHWPAAVGTPRRINGDAGLG